MHRVPRIANIFDAKVTSNAHVTVEAFQSKVQKMQLKALHLAMKRGFTKTLPETLTGETMTSYWPNAP